MVLNTVTFNPLTPTSDDTARELLCWQQENREGCPLPLLPCEQFSGCISWSFFLYLVVSLLPSCPVWYFLWPSCPLLTAVIQWASHHLSFSLLAHPPSVRRPCCYFPDLLALAVLLETAGLMFHHHLYSVLCGYKYILLRMSPYICTC